MSTSGVRERGGALGTDRSDGPIATMPEAHIGPVEVRPLPEPVPLVKLVGPSVILVGVGVATGEYVLYPYIASQVGLAFLWAAVVGVFTQFFVNMEIERYTLATGETAVTGFQRLWKPLGIILAVCAIIPTMWPAWATSAATVTTFLIGGGNANAIAIAAMLVIGVVLTASPVVYQTVEKIEFVKIGAVLLFMVVAVLAAIDGPAFSDTTQLATSFGSFPDGVEFAILAGALAAAGAGGTNNLVQSNWIRDKGYGMGKYAPRIVSPLTGHEEAAPSGKGFTFPADEENMARWKVWWKRSNVEQFFSFGCIASLAIIVFSLVAYATVYNNPDLPESSGFDFIELEGNVLKETVGSWFGTLFWAIGAVSLFAASMGIVDYVSRLVADVLRVGYLRESKRWPESRLYFIVAWGMLTFGICILLMGFDQPLALVTIATVLGGAVMCFYSCLLIAINRKFLPEPLKIRSYRLLALVWAIVMLGTVSVIVGIDQFGNLF
jgi:hypothetical protein